MFDRLTEAFIRTEVLQTPTVLRNTQFARGLGFSDNKIFNTVFQVFHFHSV